MASKQELKEELARIMERKQNQSLKIGKDLNEFLLFMEDNIKRDLESFNLLSFTICGSGKRNFKVTPEFENAFSNCSTPERLQYLQISIQRLAQRKQQTSIKILEEDWQLDGVTVKIIKGIKIKGDVQLVLKKMSLDCKNFQIDLSTYLLRKSKKEKNIFILESIISQEPSCIRMEVIDNSDVKERELMKMRRLMFKRFIDGLSLKEEAPKEIKLLKYRSNQPESLFKISSNNAVQSQEDNRQGCSEEKKENQIKTSLIEELIGNQAEGNFNEEVYDYLQRKGGEMQLELEKSRQVKYHQNRLHVLLPQNYNLGDLNAYHDFMLVETDASKRMFIYYSKKSSAFKMEIQLKNPKEKVIQHLCEPSNEKLWNRCINESQKKWEITSENASISYRKQKSLSQWYKERDFLFIRYLFKKGNSHYIIDRSIQSPYFIPFQSIQRGYIHHMICRIDGDKSETRLLIDCKIEYGGLLTSSQQKTLVEAYLREYINLDPFISNFNGVINNRYDYQWQIQDSPQLSNQSFASISSAVFEQGPQALQGMLQDEESFYSIVDEEIPHFEVTKIQQEQKRKTVALKALGTEAIQLTEQGFVILPNKYISIYHVNEPIKVEQRRRILDYQNIMLKKDFISDSKGEMVLINQTKIAAQNNVIKFIMSTLKKNLFSGKGILNISLPVEIFNVDSNLQRLCESMSMAPDILEKRAVKADEIQRFRNCIAFALSNSILYFDIDKPFNPILGETFQGFIDGCPVYAEQISHHPPISSILLIGRGYRVYGNLQAKVYVHLNSGEGVNQGLYTIQFEDGDKVLFQTAPGQVSGLAVGDRKYRIKGKMIVIAPKSRLCCVVNFQDQAGIFSSNKWKFNDQIEGEICRVSPNFIRSFFTSEKGKQFKTPNKKEMEQSLGKVTGRWTDKMEIDSNIYYDINTVPHELVHYQYPLNSNSDYREDLLYRKRDNLARSQQQKERLQIFQRNDRKLRDKYQSKTH